MYEGRRNGRRVTVKSSKPCSETGKYSSIVVPPILVPLTNGRGVVCGYKKGGRGRGEVK